MMCEYISPRSVYHIPYGHMTQFSALCDYIDQGRSKQLETHKKFVDIYRCINLYVYETYINLYVYETCMVFDDEYLCMRTCV
jgi:hypothetical protein